MGTFLMTMGGHGRAIKTPYADAFVVEGIRFVTVPRDDHLSICEYSTGRFVTLVLDGPHTADAAKARVELLLKKHGRNTLDATINLSGLPLNRWTEPEDVDLDALLGPGTEAALIDPDDYSF